MKSNAATHNVNDVEKDGKSERYHPITNTLILTAPLTLFLDRLWRQHGADVERPTFIQHCQQIFNGTRFRTGKFWALPDELNTWPGWKEVQTNFNDHLAEFHGMIEYVVSRIFKALFRDDSKTLFQWFIDGCMTKTKLTTVLMETLIRVKDGSLEQRVILAMLHSSFSRSELQMLREQHTSLYDLLNPERITEERGQNSRDE